MASDHALSANLDFPARPRVLVPLVLSTVGIAAVMTAYHAVKDWVDPEITLSESHVATTVFAALLGGVAVFVTLRRRQTLARRLLAEVMGRRQLAADVEQANSMLRAALDATTDGILVIDSERRVTAHNRRFLEVWRLDETDVAAGDDTVLLERVRTSVKDPETFVTTVERLYAQPEAESRDVIDLLDGRVLQRFSSPQRVGSQVVGRVWSFRDVTEERRAHQTIQMLAHTLRSITECVSITDMSDAVLFVNRAFVETYGYDEHDLAGRNIDIVRSPRTRPEVAGQILPATLSGGWRGELWNRRKDGTEFPVLLDTAVVHDDAGVPIALVGVARDLTEQRRTDDALRRAREAESIATLASGVAHQFNNLLQTISGEASLALDDVPPGTPLREGLQAILHATTRAAKLTAQLIAYSGQRVFELSDVDVNEEVREQAVGWRRLLATPGGLQTVLSPRLPHVMADRLQVQQMLMSLVVNAAEATGDGPGLITVRTDLMHLEAGDPRFSQASGEPLPAGRYACIHVEDEGSGMDEHTLARIFDPFFSTKFFGRGLGLPAALGIARAHGGGLEVVSAPRRGTTVRIVFPTDGAAPLEQEVAP